jgi:hypothetical protein
MKDLLLDVLFLDCFFDLLQGIAGSNNFSADECHPPLLIFAYYFCVCFIFVHISTLPKTL